MREKKFTKGPWSIHKCLYDTGFDELVDDCGSHGEFFITTQSPSFQMSAASLDRSDDESIELEANARLIAAAPELLEALEFQCLRCRADIAKHNALSEDKQDADCGDCVCGRAIAKVYGESEE